MNSEGSALDSIKESIEIRPEVNMLSVLKHLNYKAWFAIAEFIDNSLQSYISNRSTLEEMHGSDFKLKIDVRIDTGIPGRIVITDNAAGISARDFPRAFRAAQVPIDRSGLSEFGMGMKSAACWFCETWSVRTKAIGEEQERKIYFDIKNIIQNRIESLNTEIRNVERDEHYTVVTLRGLHHTPQTRTVAKIKAHLASIYRIFLREGSVVIKFNGEELRYESPNILNAVKYISPGVPDSENQTALIWRKEINLDFGVGQKVTGFAALREIGSTPLAGFALFRRNRLIEGSVDESYRPSFIFKQTNSYPYQRLFGELHLEGFEVSHTKDGFRWEDYEDIFLECLRSELLSEPVNLLAQAENYRALPTRKTIQERAEVATSAVAEFIEVQVAPLLLQAQLNPSQPSELLPRLSTNVLQASEKQVKIDDGTYEWIITLRTNVDPKSEDWVVLAKDEDISKDGPRTRRLGLDLALAHPFSIEFLGSQHENIELFLRIASAICISLVLSEDTASALPETVLYNFNYLMRGALIRASIK